MSGHFSGDFAERADGVTGRFGAGLIRSAPASLASRCGERPADASPALPAYLACDKTEPSYTFCVDDVRCAAAGCDGEGHTCPPRHLAYDPAHNAVTCITH